MHALTKFSIIFSFPFLFFQKSGGQAIKNLDSLNNVLKNERTDSNTLKKYIEFSENNTNENIAAKEIINTWIISKSEKKEFERIHVKALLLLAKNYYETGAYTQSGEFYTKVLSIGTDDNYYDLKCKAYFGLGMVFYQTDQDAEQEKLILKSKELAIKKNYKPGIASADLVIFAKLGGRDHQTAKDTFKIVFNRFRECLQIFKDFNDTPSIIKMYTEMGQYYQVYHMFDSALYSLSIAEKYITTYKKNADYSYYYFMKGKIYFHKAEANHYYSPDMNESIKNYKIAIEVSTKMNSNKIRAWAYDWLSVVYQIQKNYYQAFTYMKNYEYLYDSIVTEENFKRLAAVEHKYELGKKDNEIISLGFSNKKKSLQNKIVIGAAVALLFISFLGYRNFKSKQKLQQQQIAELEKEKQLQAVDAMLKGQEEERGRLAKDLHDGLGGMLSGVKLSFSNMKENLILDADNAVRFEKSISQLDNTIAELRKVAHNLMPEALVKFGLKSAVEDFCETLQSSSGCKIMYQQLGTDRDLGNIANVNIYRIIQELVNNAVKHANPTQIIVQLTKLPGKVLLSVEDDGKGFDVNKPDALPGIGLTNINNRVQYLNGKIDISSKKDEGTAFNIEVTA